VRVRGVASAGGAGWRRPGPGRSQSAASGAGVLGVARAAGPRARPRPAWAGRCGVAARLSPGRLLFPTPPLPEPGAPPRAPDGPVRVAREAAIGHRAAASTGGGRRRAKNARRDGPPDWPGCRGAEALRGRGATGGRGAGCGVRVRRVASASGAGWRRPGPWCLPSPALRGRVHVAGPARPVRCGGGVGAVSPAAGAGAGRSDEPQRREPWRGRGAASCVAAALALAPSHGGLPVAWGRGACGRPCCGAARTCRGSRVSRRRVGVVVGPGRRACARARAGVAPAGVGLGVASGGRSG